MSSRSARSLSPTTGTSWTLCGSACSLRSTSSTEGRCTEYVSRAAVRLPNHKSTDQKTRAPLSWIIARRRRPAAGYAVVLLGLIAVGVIYAAFTSQGSPASASSPAASQRQTTLGRQLFVQNCSSCHGYMAQGTNTGPSLIGVGAAAV